MVGAMTTFMAASIVCEKVPQSLQKKEVVFRSKCVGPALLGDVDRTQDG